MLKSIRTLICPVCGDEFTTHKLNQRFCGLTCQQASNRAETRAKRQEAKIRERECPACGTTFEPVGRQLFCSRRCTARMEARRRLGIEDPGHAAECWWCGKVFTRLHVWRVYCSEDCAYFVKSLWSLARRYGITRDDYRDAWLRQGGLCAVCSQPERSVRNRLLAIDHDHITGRFRGLLCSHCNRAIGLLQDDPEIIRSAAEYVTASQQFKLIPQEVSHG